MKPIRIDGETRRLAEEQPEYEPLSIRDEPVAVAIPDGPQTMNGMTAAFQPTPDEVAAIAKGAPIYLRILGVRWPPVSLWVGEVEEMKPIGDRVEIRTDNVPFGQFSNLIVWCGPGQIERGRETIANSLFAVGTDGEVYHERSDEAI